MSDPDQPADRRARAGRPAGRSSRSNRSTTRSRARRSSCTASDYDLRLLRRAGGFVADAMFDTMLAARLIGRREFSYAALVKAEFGIELTKGSQKANWARRPLTPTMAAYAQNDTRYLLEIADRLEGTLYQLGRWEWFEQSCARALARPPSSASATRRTPGASTAAASCGAAPRRRCANSGTGARTKPRSWTGPPSTSCATRTCSTPPRAFAAGDNPQFEHLRGGRKARFYEAAERALAWPRSDGRCGQAPATRWTAEEEKRAEAPAQASATTWPGNSTWTRRSSRRAPRSKPWPPVPPPPPSGSCPGSSSFSGWRKHKSSQDFRNPAFAGGLHSRTYFFYENIPPLSPRPFDRLCRAARCRFAGAGPRCPRHGARPPFPPRQVASAPAKPKNTKAACAGVGRTHAGRTPNAQGGPQGGDAGPVGQGRRSRRAPRRQESVSARRCARRCSRRTRTSGPSWPRCAKPSRTRRIFKRHLDPRFVVADLLLVPGGGGRSRGTICAAGRMPRTPPKLKCRIWQSAGTSAYR